MIASKGRIIFSTILVLMLSIFFSQSKFCKADEIDKELTLGKKYSGEIIEDIESLNWHIYSFSLTKKTKLTIDLESLTKTDTPSNISVGIHENWKVGMPANYDTYYKSLDFFFPYKTKIAQNVTLEKGDYEIIISNDILADGTKYNLRVYETTSNSDNVKIEKSEITVNIGSPYQLLLLDDTKAIFNSKIKWESSNTNIATVNKYGKITAKKEGTCKVTVTLPNGNKSECKVTVPKASLERQLYAKSVFAFVGEVEDKNIYNDCTLYVINKSDKDIVHIEYEIIQYNSRGQYIKSPYGTYYDDDTLSSGEVDFPTFWVNDDARKARVCVKKVTFDDGTEWKNPLYKIWHNKYYGIKY